MHEVREADQTLSGPDLALCDHPVGENAYAGYRPRRE
jgi:hypothetical protein